MLSLPEPSRFARLLRRQRLRSLVHQRAPDVRPVLRELGGDRRLANAVEIADAPVQLPQRILSRLPVALSLIFGHYSSSRLSATRFAPHVTRPGTAGRLRS